MLFSWMTCRRNWVVRGASRSRSRVSGWASHALTLSPDHDPEPCPAWSPERDITSSRCDRREAWPRSATVGGRQNSNPPWRACVQSAYADPDAWSRHSLLPPAHPAAPTAAAEHRGSKIQARRGRPELLRMYG